MTAVTVQLAPIVVAIGDSMEEDSSLLFASAEAVRTGRPLLVAHVVHGNVPVAPHNLLISYETAGSVGHHLVVHAATRLKMMTEDKVRVETLVPRGGVVDQLVRLSRTAHMIVMEQRDLTRLQRVFTGSVSGGVAGRSAVEVVMVPELWQPPEGFVNRVVVGVGSWRGANGLFEHAFDAADQHQAPLSVLHSWDLPSTYQDSLLDAMAAEQWRDEVAGQIEAAFAEAHRRHPGVKTTVDVVHARPADALLEASRGADLMVLGRRDVAHPAVQHAGSLTRALLRVSECPVSVVPRPFD